LCHPNALLHCKDTVAIVDVDVAYVVIDGVVEVVIDGVVEVEVEVEYLCCGIVAIFSHRMMIVTMFNGTDIIMMMVIVD